jgi:hypothetical protein
VFSSLPCLNIIYIYEGCSNETRSGTALGEWAEAIKNSPHGCCGGHPTEVPVEGSPLHWIPWAAAGTAVLLQPWCLHSIKHVNGFHLNILYRWKNWRECDYPSNKHQLMSQTMWHHNSGSVRTAFRM